MALVPGTTVGPYRILEPLGRGGMAAVYKAYEAALDRYVALKVLPGEFLHDPTFAERFAREAKVVARLEHPNIVPIHAFGIEDRVPWMAMRLVSGGALSTLLKKERLAGDRVIRILRGVAEALDYAHGKGVVHRDVKPHNVLLDEHERAYLADFGIARMVEGSSALTATGMISGTPHYMSPEQAMGKPVDHRADLYALGIMAYEMLTGRVPFAADTPVAVLLKHVTEPLPLPSQMDFPEAAVRAILKGVAKKPGDRWPSAHTFVEALATGLEGVELEVIEVPSGTMTLGPSALEPLTANAGAAPPLPLIPAGVPVPRPQEGIVAPSRRSIFPGAGWAAALGTAGLVAALTVAWFAQRRPPVFGPADREAGTGAAREAPRSPDSGRGAPEEGPATSRRATSQAPTISVGTDPAEGARLAIDFDHGFKAGSLRVFVDGQLVLEQRLSGRAKKKLVAFKGWKGSVDEVLEVAPGPHTVRVQVAWDDNVRGAEVRGQFAQGATRQLQITVGGLRKNVSLEWR